jgi:hypothetical protein
MTPQQNSELLDLVAQLRDKADDMGINKDTLVQIVRDCPPGSVEEMREDGFSETTIAWVAARQAKALRQEPQQPNS